MTDQRDYWKSMDALKGNAAPTTAFFRFVGAKNFSFDRKRVLEVGFFRGADLLEAARRGASIFGIDINQSAVDMMSNTEDPNRFARVDIGSQPIPFETKFDLIYALDMVCYLSDTEIRTMLCNCLDSLDPLGYLVIQFIQGDWVRNPTQPPLDREESAKWKLLEGSFASDNPLRILECGHLINLAKSIGGELVGEKTTTETFGLDERFMRSNKFLMFRRSDELNKVRV